MGGKWVNFLNPQPEQIDIRDVARGLAYEYRWCGQGVRRITVAEHSIAAARVALKRDKGHRVAQLALLHDAHEFAMKDLPTPLKVCLEEYEVLASRLQAAILAAFNVQPPTAAETEAVDEIDSTLAILEAQAGFAPAGFKADKPVAPDWGVPLLGSQPWIAEEDFLRLFNRLIG